MFVEINNVKMWELSAETEMKLPQIISINEKIIDAGTAALAKFPQEEYKLELFIYLNFLERFVSNLLSVNILLKHLKENPQIETSIGLTIRASLLDFMTITYLSTYIEEDILQGNRGTDSKYDREFKAFLADHVQSGIKYLKLTRDCGIIKNDEYKQGIDNIYKTYGLFFVNKQIDYTNPEKHLISTETISPTKMFKRISSQPSTINHALVYDAYTYYSKYEHFGMVTNFLQRQGIDHDVEMIILSIKYIIMGIGASMSLISEPNDILSKERIDLEKLRTEFSTV